MKARIALSSLFLCATLFANDDVIGLHDATYAGSGVWNDSNEEEGSYDLHLEFRNNTMRVDYHWPEGVITEHLTFLFAGDSFDVLDREGLVVGQGTRNSFGGLSYRIETANGYYNETIHFLSGLPGIIKEGEKRVGDHVITWRENLQNLAFVNPSRNQ